MPGKKAKPYKRNLIRIMIGTRKMAVLGLSTHSLSNTPSSEEITIQRNRVRNSRVKAVDVRRKIWNQEYIRTHGDKIMRE